MPGGLTLSFAMHLVLEENLCEGIRTQVVFLTGRMSFLPLNQQCQCNEGNTKVPIQTSGLASSFLYPSLE